MSLNAPAAAVPTVNVTFSLSSPGARAVDVAFFFNAWSTEAPFPPQMSRGELKWKGPMSVRSVMPLKQEKPGLWCCELPLLRGWYEYLFLVDGAWVMDPDATEVCPDGAAGFNAARMVEPVATCDYGPPSSPGAARSAGNFPADHADERG